MVRCRSKAVEIQKTFLVIPAKAGIHWSNEIYPDVSISFKAPLFYGVKRMCGKEKISPKQFAGILLSLTNTWGERFRSLFVNELGFKGKEKVLNVEVKILSLWIIILALPNDQYRDLIHMSFCEKVGFSKEQTDLFLQQVDLRYRTYFEAYNMWVNNPANGHMIGSAIIETILNGHVGYSPKTDPLPWVRADDALMVYIHFGEKFKATLGLIKDLRDKYHIEGM